VMHQEIQWHVIKHVSAFWKYSIYWTFYLEDCLFHPYKMFGIFSIARNRFYRNVLMKNYEKVFLNQKLFEVWWMLGCHEPDALSVCRIHPLLV
jgi:hypothetical protein